MTLSLPEILHKIKTCFQPEKAEDPQDPDAPFAMVGAPKKPRPPLRHSSVAVQPEP